MTAIALLASCTNEMDSDGTLPQASQEIEMTVTIVEGTRALTTCENGLFNTTLQKGDLVGVHLLYGAIGESPIYDPMNVKYKVSEKGKLISLGKPIKFPKTEGYSLVAYYPYKEEYDPAYEKKYFTVRADQTSDEDFELSNFMNFSVALTPETLNSIPLKFTSRIAMASLTLTEKETEGLKAAYINVYLTGGMEMQGGRPNFVTQGDIASVKMHKMEDGLYAAFVPAQKVSTSSPLFTLEYADGSVKQILPNSPMLMNVATVTELRIGKNHNVVMKGE